MILTIARRELKAMFASPLAWVILAVVQFICAWLYLTGVDNFLTIQPRLAAIPNAPGVTDLIAAPLLSSTSIVLLMVMPLLTMRLISEERRSGTLTLLMSAPISATEIALGKFLGMFAFMLIVVAMISMMPFALLAGTQIDLGKVFSGLVGLSLMVGAFSAIGLYLSSLTRQPVVAAVGTFGVLLLLWIFNFAAEKSSAFAWLSLMHHYNKLLRGLMNSTDVVYYVMVIAVFVILTIRRLDADRLRS
ncbi:MAG TPA: ABC transporter permease [Gammaproteobacteria bacterium]|nr:ABC transporter permease [Gammaproteobacteria bacterium]HET8551528.1 ABC transporter permease [Gammaproteobacteria bacterium]